MEKYRILYDNYKKYYNIVKRGLETMLNTRSANDIIGLPNAQAEPLAKPKEPIFKLQIRMIISCGGITW